MCCGSILCRDDKTLLDGKFLTSDADGVFWIIVLIAFCLAPKLNFDEDKTSSTVIFAELTKLLLPLLLVFLLSVLSAGLVGRVTRVVPPRLATMLNLLDDWEGVLAMDKLISSEIVARSFPLLPALALVWLVATVVLSVPSA